MAKVQIRVVEDGKKKADVTRRVLTDLSEWFTSRADIEKSAMMSMDHPMYAAYLGDEILGFSVVKAHNEKIADVYKIGIVKDYHRNGIGKVLLSAAEDYAREHGFDYIMVRLPAAPKKGSPLEGTCGFFADCGYMPFDRFRELKNELDQKLCLAKFIGEGVKLPKAEKPKQEKKPEPVPEPQPEPEEEEQEELEEIEEEEYDDSISIPEVDEDYFDED